MHHRDAHEVAGAPVALDEAPRACDVNRVPAVPEAAALKADAWLVAGRLAVALHNGAMEAGVAVAFVVVG